MQINRMMRHQTSLDGSKSNMRAAKAASYMYNNVAVVVFILEKEKQTYSCK